MISSEFFIKHPRFSTVVSCVLVLFGVMAIVVLPISQYPQITPPQIVVSAVYPGASAEVIQATVAVPIENELNGVEGMLYMSSTSSDTGEYKLTITFNIGVDPDMAQVKVENRLQQVTATLPDIVSQEGLTVVSETADILGMLVLHSPNGTYNDLDLSNFAHTYILNSLERVSGVSSATVYGPQHSIRIWMNPVKLTALGLTGEDIVQTIQNQNTQAAIGAVGSAPSDKEWGLVLTMSAKGLLESVSDFENIIVTTDEKGGTVRLKDVARVEMGADSYTVQSTYNNEAAVIIGLSQTPNSNSLEVMKNIKKLMEKIKQTLPNDMEFDVAYDSTQFVRASIDSILSTLLITFSLVIGVVFIFLQKAKATLIPMLTIPVSLIATFAVIYVMGFDINILTLFAMILAIGLVVDDAIIVVERVQYLMKYNNMESVPASIQAMKDIGSAIVATTLVLLAIFVPVALMAGITGKIYQQFAITIATAVVFSAINALTLSPALCAVFLGRPDENRTSNSFFKKFNQILDYSKNKYQASVSFFSNRIGISVLFILFVGCFIGFLFYKTPTSFIPQEDEGVIFANIQLAETAGINRTNAVIDDLGKSVLKMDGVKYYIGISGASLLGAGGENIGMGVVGLQDWKKRTQPDLSLNAIMSNLRKTLGQNPWASVNFFALPAIPGVGNSDGLSFQLNAVNPDLNASDLGSVVVKLLEQLNTTPNIIGAFTTFSADVPHLFLNLDRVKLESLKVPVSKFFSTLQNNLGSRYVNDITVEGQMNKVIISSDFNYRKTMQDVQDLHIKTNTDQMVQVKDFVDLGIKMMPSVIYRFNMYLSAAITAQITDKVASGDMIKTIEKMAKQMGKDYELAWTGLSLQEVETSGMAIILIGLSLIFCYLFLVALYESWMVAFSVIFSNVFAILGALLGLWLMGLSLSIYAQLGLVLLIGLASKNAILIVEFILDYRKKGLGIVESAVKGASERFRAVLMTALTFILGVMPMLFDTGAGAASQNSMGTTVFFGMLCATMIGIVFVSPLFVIFAKVSRQPDVLKGTKKIPMPARIKHALRRKKEFK